MKKIGRTENLLSKKRRQKYPAFFELKLNCFNLFQKMSNSS